MSVLCCQVADLPLKLMYRDQPDLAARPVALLDANERTAFVSSEAQQCGVQKQMTVQQARLRCPDLAVQPLDRVACKGAQGAFLEVITSWALPVEQQGLGQAYIDLQQVADRRRDVEGLAAELGRTLRKAVGLDPSLGWDHGKFTARAAAARASPGRMRLVNRDEEVPFLAPLPITLLPLSGSVLEQLGWLGVRTLGSFAALPTAAVYQRFGKVGRVAQQWARGEDPRPVVDNVRAVFAPMSIPLDPPTGLLPPVLDALMAELAPRLQQMAGHLEGCRHLRLALHFIDGDEHVIDITFVEPISSQGALLSSLTHHLQTLIWPGELSTIFVTALESGELPAQQMALFPEVQADYSPLRSLVNRLKGRYGSIFFRGLVDDPTHLVSERRFVYDALVA
ncbi:hypothetical protein KFU94_37190 [Chloroflexi bacterium TSY]|nr:hypothetical protein [Chloroflexi bacterium TSY]